MHTVSPKLVKVSPETHALLESLKYDLRVPSYDQVLRSLIREHAERVGSKSVVHSVKSEGVTA